MVGREEAMCRASKAENRREVMKLQGRAPLGEAAHRAPPEGSCEREAAVQAAPASPPPRSSGRGLSVRPEGFEWGGGGGVRWV